MVATVVCPLDRRICSLRAPLQRQKVASREAGTGGGQDTDQEAGARDGKALFVEVGTAEKQEHVGLMLLLVLLKDLGEFPQLGQVRGEPQ